MNVNTTQMLDQLTRRQMVGKKYHKHESFLPIKVNKQLLPEIQIL